MPIAKQRTSSPPRLRGRMARNAAQSRYPHLWDGAVFLAAPGLGFQGERLIDWTRSTRGVSLINRTDTPEITWNSAETTPGDARSNIVFNMGTTTRDYGASPDVPSTNLSGDLTIMAWVRQDQQFGGANAIVLTKGFNNVSLENYGMWLLRSGAGDPAGSLIFEINAGGTVLTFPTPTAAGLTLWYHYALTLHGNIVTPYRGGMQFADTQTIPAGLTVNRNVGIEIAGTAASSSYGLRGSIDDMRVYNRALSSQEILTSYLVPLTPYQPSPRFWSFTAAATTLQISPAKVAWQAATLVPAIPVNITPAKMGWQLGYIIRSTGPVTTTITPATLLLRGNDLTITKSVRVEIATAKAVLRANDLTMQDVRLTVLPTQMAWSATRTSPLTQVALRDCGVALDAALAQAFIAGDFLIQAPDVGLKLSFHYDPDGTWDHRIKDISAIEVSAPSGGGIASVANVTIQILEDGTGQSLLELLEAASDVHAVEITIDFLLDGFTEALRLFTGKIDTVTIKNAISTIECVDASIQEDILLPQTLITSKIFPNADDGATTQPMPLVYGRGIHMPGAPLLLIDTSTQTYLVAGHNITFGGALAVFNRNTNTFMALPNVLPLRFPGDGLITLGTVDTGVMTLQEQAATFAGYQAIDGNSQTLAQIQTAGTDSNGVDGIGWLGVTPGGTGYPNTGTFQVTLTNHRRFPTSDPTVTGTFTIRTIDPSSGGVLRILHTTPSYRHATSAQTDIITLSNQTIGADELLEVIGVARCEGQVANASNTYEIGEISITPVVAYSANVSGEIAALTLPFSLQNANFNAISHNFIIIENLGTIFPSNAVDGISTTLAIVSTGNTDSNLDGVGYLAVGTQTNVFQRGNNTVNVNFERHRRSLGSDPTVTGQFSLLQANSENRVGLQNNFFVTQQFRQTLNPLTTSFTITSVELGATTMLAVLLVARNEGGPGNSLQTYEVGDIGVRTFYKSQGDADNIFLVAVDDANQWTGRSDTDGSVLAYAGYTDFSTPIPLTLPTQVIASILITELGVALDTTSFSNAEVWYNTNQYVFAGGIGAQWSVQRARSRQILHDLALQAAAVLFPIYDGTFGIRPYRPDPPIQHHFDVTNILYEEGAENSQGDQNSETFQVSIGNMANVHNRFELHYGYNPGNGKYNKVFIIDENGSNLPEAYEYKGELESLCLQSFNKYGKLEPFVLEAYWIGIGDFDDEYAARHLFRHLVTYFSSQRITVQFETTFAAMCLQVADFVTIDYPTLPVSDNGKTFEVHSTRISPMSGRIHITASRRETLSTTIVIQPAKMGWAAPGQDVSQILMISPAKMGWAAIGSRGETAAVILLVIFQEFWEFSLVNTDEIRYIEGWER